MILLRVLLLTIALSHATISANAHEFWVAPKRHMVAPGEQIVADLRVGQMMRGTEIPYLASKFQSFTVTTRGGVKNVGGMAGDIPALSYAATQPGLHVISYHSSVNELIYENWAKFLETLNVEGLEELAQVHRDRGLPDEQFKETYFRYAKALVQAGPVGAQDRDTATGAPLELIAEDNPYTPALDTMTVTLLRFGKPVAGRQIAVFRFDGEVTRTLVFTDAQGQAVIPLAAGGRFLLNAVDFQPVEGDDAVWESYWASLSFGLPVVLSNVHPLDPLSRVEIARAIRVIGKSGHAERSTRVALVTLAEPDKAEMLAWTPGVAAKRKAFAVVHIGPDVFEAVIDIAAGTLDRWEKIPGAQPLVRSEEWAKAQGLTKQDPRWITAMQQRGYEDFTEIFCESLTAGYFDLPEDRGRRLIKMPCYDIAGATSNIYGRPIEGLISIVDVNKGEVVRVIDEGPVTVSTDSHAFDEASIADLAAQMHPVRTEAPDGWNFAVDGRAITWQDWSFHLGFDQRFGPVLSLARHRDRDARRMVLYQGHLSEVFVPYMDASQGWYSRSYMDAGEYGLGLLSSPLAPGLDCPQNAVYFDADLVTSVGKPFTRARILCVFERDTGAPLWRHWEALDGTYEGRPATELVVRSIPSVGNYDYIVDWVFTQKGEIRVDLGATGIDAVKGVAAATMQDPGAKDATRSGILVAPNLVAVHHDHYFSVRLDIDVDGPLNSFRRERLVPASLPDGHPRRSLWRLEPVSAPDEGAYTARHGMELWRFENPGARTALGHHPSYQIAAGKSTTSLLSPDDWPQRRAAFSGEALWVTARRPGELFAAGPYPNQSPGGEGLPSYVDGDSLAATDIVAWYTIGFHHLTRPEDWPILPTVWHRVSLRPYGFFDRNPGLGVRREFVGEKLPARASGRQ